MGERTVRDREKCERNKSENVCVNIYPQMGKEKYRTSEDEQLRGKIRQNSEGTKPRKGEGSNLRAAAYFRV